MLCVYIVYCALIFVWGALISCYKVLSFLLCVTFGNVFRNTYRNFLSVQADWKGTTFVYQSYDMFRFNGGKVVVIVIGRYVCE